MCSVLIKKKCLYEKRQIPNGVVRENQVLDVTSLTDLFYIFCIPAEKSGYHLCMATDETDCDVSILDQDQLSNICFVNIFLTILTTSLSTCPNRRSMTFLIFALALSLRPNLSLTSRLRTCMSYTAYFS